MFNPDVPIQTASDDVLGRHSFAEQLARAMISYDSPEAFTIGLYGPWGSGKTSVINLLEEELNKQSDDCIIVRFNPWLCSTPDQMISQFFEQLKSDIRTLESKQSATEAIGNFAGISKKICEAVGEYADALKWTRVIPGLNALGTIFEALGTGTEIYQKIVGDADNPQSLQDHKNRIQRILKEQKQKIIVIIDDLDRLSSDEIVAVFQLVKSLADFPYIIYLLAFDRDIVVKALEDVQKGNGQAYLGKIVQMPFELPCANHIDIEQVFLKRLEEVLEGKEYCDQGTDWELLFDDGIRPYLDSIRDVTRYINTFALKYAMLKNETDPLDLIAVTCMQVFEPETFSRLSFYSDILCGTDVDCFFDDEEETAYYQKIHETLMKTVLPEKREAADSIIFYLFPKWERCIGLSTSYRYCDVKKSLRKYRIADEDCFNRYFSLNLEHDAISDGEMHYILLEADQDIFIKKIQELIEQGKMHRFLSELREYFLPEQKSPNLISADRAEQLVIWFCEQWEIIQKVAISSVFGPFTARRRLLEVILELLKVIPVEKRYNLVKTIMSSSEISLGIIHEILANLECYQNRFVERGKKYSDTVVMLEEVKELETVFMERTLEELRAGTLVNEEDANAILGLMENIDAERTQLAQMKAAIQKRLNDNVFLAKFVAIHVSREDSLGDVIWNSDIDPLLQYMDLQEATVRVERLLMSEAGQQTEEQDKRKLAAFLIAVDFKNNGEEQEISDDMVDEKLNALAAH